MVKRAKWKDIQGKVKNMEGTTPKSQHCVKNAVQRVQASGKKGVAMTNYKNCGRKRKLTAQEEKMVVDYVQKWRRKLFCTCDHIKKELKLDVGRMSILRTLGRHGYHWKQIPQKSFFKPEHLQMRNDRVDKSSAPHYLSSGLQISDLSRSAHTPEAHIYAPPLHRSAPRRRPVALG